jgi:hypothetical protein
MVEKAIKKQPKEFVETFNFILPRGRAHTGEEIAAAMKVAVKLCRAKSENKKKLPQI